MNARTDSVHGVGARCNGMAGPERRGLSRTGTARTEAHGRGLAELEWKGVHWLGRQWPGPAWLERIAEQRYGTARIGAAGTESIGTERLVSEWRGGIGMERQGADGGGRERREWEGMEWVVWVRCGTAGMAWCDVGGIGAEWPGWDRRDRRAREGCGKGRTGLAGTSCTGVVSRGTAGMARRALERKANQRIGRSLVVRTGLERQEWRAAERPGPQRYGVAGREAG